MRLFAVRLVVVMTYFLDHSYVQTQTTSSIVLLFQLWSLAERVHVPVSSMVRCPSRLAAFELSAMRAYVQAFANSLQTRARRQRAQWSCACASNWPKIFPYLTSWDDVKRREVEGRIELTEATHHRSLRIQTIMSIHRRNLIAHIALALTSTDLCHADSITLVRIFLASFSVGRSDAGFRQDVGRR